MESKKRAKKAKAPRRESVILFIDNSLLDHELIRMAFRRYGLDTLLEFVSTGEAGLDVIGRKPVRAVFVSVELPGMDGFIFLRSLRHLGISLPVVVLIPVWDEELNLRALREGAYDCVTKGVRYFDSLPLILDRAVARFELDEERKRQEQVISESQRQWTAVFDSITDYIFISDAEGRIAKANRALAAAFGKHPRDIIGERCFELFGISKEEACSIEENTGPKTEEKMIGGESYLVSSFPFPYGDKQLVIHIMKNMTEMKRLKDQLHHSDKLASLGLLVSGVAHEINNPLTGIIAYTELLRMKLAETEYDRDLKKVLDSADRCKKIVENLLTFSRQRTPTKTLESINDVIDRAIELRIYWLRSSNIEIIRDYGALQSVFIDSQQIQQVFLNLLLNAEQAIVGAGIHDGQITFRTRYNSETRSIIITVSDNGPGIPADILPRIFDPFFTTKPVGTGTGLGLSISHGIVTEHGGRIFIDTGGGPGATFTIELPLPTVGGTLLNPPEGSIVIGENPSHRYSASAGVENLINQYHWYL